MADDKAREDGAQRTDVPPDGKKRGTAQNDARDLGVEVLLAVDQNDTYLDRALAEVFARQDAVSRHDRAFVGRVSKGCVERRIELDYILDQFSDTKTQKMKPVIRAILRSALYQLLYLDAAPDAVVVNETVRITKKRGFSGLSGFVNGVLRAIARNKDAISCPPMDEDPVRALSVRYSMPEWIVTRYLDAYGQERCARILEAYLAERPLCVRVDTRAKAPEEVKASLEAQGIRVTVDPRLSYAFLLEGYDRLEEIPEFADGTLYPQDVASMMAVELADPQLGDAVLDVCAAPGGKSMHAASRIQRAGAAGDWDGQCVRAADVRAGQVTARDLTREKTAVIRENLARCHVPNVRAEVWDARVSDPRWVNEADLVIADLPCSGLGVIGHKPDIKYHASEEGIRDLAEKQREILAAAADYVRPGGTLLYSTCTMTEEENGENVQWFLARFPAFSLARELQLLPDEGCDGFYMAKLQREA